MGNLKHDSDKEWCQRVMFLKVCQVMKNRRERDIVKREKFQKKKGNMKTRYWVKKKTDHVSKVRRKCQKGITLFFSLSLLVNMYYWGQNAIIYCILSENILHFRNIITVSTSEQYFLKYKSRHRAPTFPRQGGVKTLSALYSENVSWQFV